MSRMLITGNGAAAWAARQAKADYIPVFPITPQTEIVETLSDWIDRGDMSARMVTLESEHSMMAAAGAAAATGVRVFTATSSQGLLYAMEMLYTVSGWRVPLVLVNISRGLSAPITLEPDHNDVMAARDSGFLQLHAATVQEVFDLTLLAYRLAEDPRVRLPVLVNLDGFYLSFTREPVDIAAAQEVQAFLPPFDAMGTAFRAEHPQSQGVAVLGGSLYSYFRYETHLAALGALPVYEEHAAQFAKAFGRARPAVDCYRCEDAEYAFVMIGAFATKAMAAVDALRDAGWRIGLVRPRLLRPWPHEPLVAALRGLRGVAVVDQNLAPGAGGVLHSELCASLYRAGLSLPVAPFVGGLGGRDIPLQEFVAIANALRDAAERGESPPPQLLFTADELAQARRAQTLAAGA